jgi:hypothetical protein
MWLMGFVLRPPEAEQKSGFLGGGRLHPCILFNETLLYTYDRLSRLRGCAYVSGDAAI